MKTTIILEGVRLYARHGVDPQETAVGALFTVDLRIETDFRQALETDRLDGTVSYADVFGAVKEEMQTPSALLEHVAGCIARRLFRDFPSVSALSLKLMKQNPPMGADCVGAGVELSCRRGELD